MSTPNRYQGKTNPYDPTNDPAYNMNGDTDLGVDDIQFVAPFNRNKLFESNDMDDILRMQEQFLMSKQAPSAKVQRLDSNGNEIIATSPHTVSDTKPQRAQTSDNSSITIADDNAAFNLFDMFTGNKPGFDDLLQEDGNNNNNNNNNDDDFYQDDTDDYFATRASVMTDAAELSGTATSTGIDRTKVSTRLVKLNRTETQKTNPIDSRDVNPMMINKPSTFGSKLTLGYAIGNSANTQQPTTQNKATQVSTQKISSGGEKTHFATVTTSTTTKKTANKSIDDDEIPELLVKPRQRPPRAKKTVTIDESANTISSTSTTTPAQQQPQKQPSSQTTKTPIVDEDNAGVPLVFNANTFNPAKMAMEPEDVHAIPTMPSTATTTTTTKPIKRSNTTQPRSILGDMQVSFTKEIDTVFDDEVGIKKQGNHNENKVKLDLGSQVVQRQRPQRGAAAKKAATATTAATASSAEPAIKPTQPQYETKVGVNARLKDQLGEFQTQQQHQTSSRFKTSGAAAHLQHKQQQQQQQAPPKPKPQASQIAGVSRQDIDNSVNMLLQSIGGDAAGFLAEALGGWTPEEIERFRNRHNNQPQNNNIDDGSESEQDTGVGDDDIIDDTNVFDLSQKPKEYVNDIEERQRLAKLTQQKIQKNTTNTSDDNQDQQPHQQQQIISKRNSDWLKPIEKEENRFTNLHTIPSGNNNINLIHQNNLYHKLNTNTQQQQRQNNGNAGGNKTNSNDKYNLFDKLSNILNNGGGGSSVATNSNNNTDNDDSIDIATQNNNNNFTNNNNINLKDSSYIALTTQLTDLRFDLEGNIVVEVDLDAKGNEINSTSKNNDTTGEYRRELYHHGKQAGRGGYTIDELIIYLRSTYYNQIAIALRCLYYITINARQGKYNYFYNKYTQRYTLKLIKNQTSCDDDEEEILYNYFTHNISSTLLETLLLRDIPILTIYILVNNQNGLQNKQNNNTTLIFYALQLLNAFLSPYYTPTITNNKDQHNNQIQQYQSYTNSPLLNHSHLFTQPTNNYNLTILNMLNYQQNKAQVFYKEQQQQSNNNNNNNTDEQDDGIENPDNIVDLSEYVNGESSGSSTSLQKNAKSSTSQQQQQQQQDSNIAPMITNFIYNNNNYNNLLLCSSTPMLQTTNSYQYRGYYLHSDTPHFMFTLLQQLYYKYTHEKVLNHCQRNNIPLVLLPPNQDEKDKATKDQHGDDIGLDLQHKQQQYEQSMLTKSIQYSWKLEEYFSTLNEQDKNITINNTFNNTQIMLYDVTIGCMGLGLLDQLYTLLQYYLQFVYPNIFYTKEVDNKKKANTDTTTTTGKTDDNTSFGYDAFLSSASPADVDDTTKNNTDINTTGNNGLIHLKYKYNKNHNINIHNNKQFLNIINIILEIIFNIIQYHNITAVIVAEFKGFITILAKLLTPTLLCDVLLSGVSVNAKSIDGNVDGGSTDITQGPFNTHNQTNNNNAETKLYYNVINILLSLASTHPVVLTEIDKQCSQAIFNGIMMFYKLLLTLPVDEPDFDTTASSSDNKREFYYSTLEQSDEPLDEAMQQEIQSYRKDREERTRHKQVRQQTRQALRKQYQQSFIEFNFGHVNLDVLNYLLYYIISLYNVNNVINLSLFNITNDNVFAIYNFIEYFYYFILLHYSRQLKYDEECHDIITDAESIYNEYYEQRERQHILTTTPLVNDQQLLQSISLSSMLYSTLTLYIVTNLESIAPANVITEIYNVNTNNVLTVGNKIDHQNINSLAVNNNNDAFNKNNTTTLKYINILQFNHFVQQRALPIFQMLMFSQQQMLKTQKLTIYQHIISESLNVFGKITSPKYQTMKQFTSNNPPLQQKQTGNAPNNTTNNNFTIVDALVEQHYFNLYYSSMVKSFSGLLLVLQYFYFTLPHTTSINNINNISSSSSTNLTYTQITSSILGDSVAQLAHRTNAIIKLMYERIAETFIFGMANFIQNSKDNNQNLQSNPSSIELTSSSSSCNQYYNPIQNALEMHHSFAYINNNKYSHQQNINLNYIITHYTTEYEYQLLQSYLNALLNKSQSSILDGNSLTVIYNSSFAEFFYDYLIENPIYQTSHHTMVEANIGATNQLFVVDYYTAVCKKLGLTAGLSLLTTKHNTAGSQPKINEDLQSTLNDVLFKKLERYQQILSQFLTAGKNVDGRNNNNKALHILTQTNMYTNLSLLNNNNINKTDRSNTFIPAEHCNDYYQYLYFIIIDLHNIFINYNKNNVANNTTTTNPIQLEEQLYTTLSLTYTTSYYLINHFLMNNNYVNAITLLLNIFTNIDLIIYLYIADNTTNTLANGDDMNIKTKNTVDPMYRQWIYTCLSKIVTILLPSFSLNNTLPSCPISYFTPYNDVLKTYNSNTKSEQQPKQQQQNDGTNTANKNTHQNDWVYECSLLFKEQQQQQQNQNNTNNNPIDFSNGNHLLFLQNISYGEFNHILLPIDQLLAEQRYFTQLRQKDPKFKKQHNEENNNQHLIQHFTFLTPELFDMDNFIFVQEKEVEEEIEEEEESNNNNKQEFGINIFAKKNKKVIKKKKIVKQFSTKQCNQILFGLNLITTLISKGFATVNVANSGNIDAFSKKTTLPASNTTTTLAEQIYKNHLLLLNTYLYTSITLYLQENSIISLTGTNDVINYDLGSNVETGGIEMWLYNSLLLNIFISYSKQISTTTTQTLQTGNNNNNNKTNNNNIVQYINLDWLYISSNYYFILKCFNLFLEYGENDFFIYLLTLFFITNYNKYYAYTSNAYGLTANNDIMYWLYVLSLLVVDTLPQIFVKNINKNVILCYNNDNTMYYANNENNTNFVTFAKNNNLKQNNTLCFTNPLYLITSTQTKQYMTQQPQEGYRMLLNSPLLTTTLTNNNNNNEQHILSKSEILGKMMVVQIESSLSTRNTPTSPPSLLPHNSTLLKFITTLYTTKLMNNVHYKQFTQQIDNNNTPKDNYYVVPNVAVYIEDIIASALFHNIITLNQSNTPGTAKKTNISLLQSTLSFTNFVNIMYTDVIKSLITTASFSTSLDSSVDDSSIPNYVFVPSLFDDSATTTENSNNITLLQSITQKLKEHQTTQNIIFERIMKNNDCVYLNQALTILKTQYKQHYIEEYNKFAQLALSQSSNSSTPSGIDDLVKLSVTICLIDVLPAISSNHD